MKSTNYTKNQANLISTKISRSPLDIELGIKEKNSDLESIQKAISKLDLIKGNSPGSEGGPPLEPGERWITINGRHILVNSNTGEVKQGGKGMSDGKDITHISSNASASVKTGKSPLSEQAQGSLNSSLKEAKDNNFSKEEFLDKFVNSNYGDDEIENEDKILSYLGDKYDEAVGTVKKKDKSEGSEDRNSDFRSSDFNHNTGKSKYESDQSADYSEQGAPTDTGSKEGTTDTYQPAQEDLEDFADSINDDTGKSKYETSSSKANDIVKEIKSGANPEQFEQEDLIDALLDLGYEDASKEDLAWQSNDELMSKIKKQSKNKTSNKKESKNKDNFKNKDSNDEKVGVERNNWNEDQAAAYADGYDPNDPEDMKKWKEENSDNRKKNTTKEK